MLERYLFEKLHEDTYEKITRGDQEAWRFAVARASFGADSTASRRQFSPRRGASYDIRTGNGSRRAFKISPALSRFAKAFSSQLGPFVRADVNSREFPNKSATRSKFPAAAFRAKSVPRRFFPTRSKGNRQTSRFSSA